jgi:hypothetical protein
MMMVHGKIKNYNKKSNLSKNMDFYQKFYKLLFFDKINKNNYNLNIDIKNKNKMKNVEIINNS